MNSSEVAAAVARVELLRDQIRHDTELLNPDLADADALDLLLTQVARLAALRAPREAPADLVALVQEWQDVLNGYQDGQQDLQELDGRLAVVQEKLLLWAMPSRRMWTSTARPARDGLRAGTGSKGSLGRR